MKNAIKNGNQGIEVGYFFSDISIQPLCQINKKNPIPINDNRLFFGATIQILS